MQHAQPCAVLMSYTKTLYFALSSKAGVDIETILTVSIRFQKCTDTLVSTRFYFYDFYSFLETHKTLASVFTVLICLQKRIETLDSMLTPVQRYRIHNIVILIIPCCLTSMLTILTFFVPPDTGEKISLSKFCLTFS